MTSVPMTSDVGESSMDDQPSTSRRDEDEREADGHTQFEILHAIERFLEGGRFGRAAAALRRDINEKKLVPARTDFEGTNHDQNYRQFLSALSQLPSTSRFTGDTLPAMISRLSALSDGAVAPPVRGLKLRLMTNRRSALQKKNDVLLPASRPDLIHGNRGHAAVPKTKRPPIEYLRARELGSRVPASLLPGERSIELIERHFRILGHLANVFCVTFDRTENYLITGADDNLIKVWNVNHAMLKFTYRDHSAEIADMSVSYCNQLVASAANDKTVRVWKLQNGETMHVFHQHTAAVTSVLFIPFIGNAMMRYLISTGNDCTVNFYQFNEETLEFPVGNFNHCEGLVYHAYERDQPGAKMISISTSESGHIVVVGESHGVIRVYRMHTTGVEKLSDITAHTDRVDSLTWSHNDGLRFCSGSKDGTAKIWKFECGEWHQTLLALSQTELIAICGVNATLNNPNSKNKYKVSMVCFTRDDSRLVTTGSDHSLRVWNTTTGAQLMKLFHHTDDAFHLCAHPIHSHLILSAGHDGLVAMWDVLRGVAVHQWKNIVEQGEVAAIFDLVQTKDATRFAIVDNKGHVSVFGLGTNKSKHPREQFFSTDYWPTLKDGSGYVLDETTGIAPHLMPPAKLLSVELVEYSDDVQAMVPGRDVGIVDEADLVCAWLTRDIVPKMGKNEMRRWAERMHILNERERDKYDEEKERLRPSATPTPDVIVPFSNRGKVRASRPTPLAQAQARSRQNARVRTSNAQQLGGLRRDVFTRNRGIDPDMNGQDEALDLANNDLEDDDEEEEVEIEIETDPSDTDYESDGERRERRSEREREREAARIRTSSRPRRRERQVEMDDDADLDESSQHSRSERRRRRRREEDDFGNDLSIDMFDLPSTSTGRRRGRREETQERSEGVERSEQSNGRKKRVIKTEERDEDEDMEEDVHDMEEETVDRGERRTKKRQSNVKDAWKNTYPDWMREVKRKRVPYVAQIGDQVVYFRQGHEHYLTEVERTGLYPLNSKMQIGPEIGLEEFAVVDEVKYRLKPYRLTQLTLARIDSTGRRTGQKFDVIQHDMDNVPDFIINKAFFDEAMAMGLDVGDEIEACMEDKWWYGTVENVNMNPLDTHWLCVGVRWNSGDDDNLSPWELRKKTTGGRTDQSVTEEETIALGSVPYREGDWPEGDENGESTRRRMKMILNELSPIPTVIEFSNPVPIDLYTDYPARVAYPMDLQTICERIDNQYYRRFLSLLQDVRYIALAAETYNLEDAPIVRNAKVLVAAVIRMANDPTVADITSFFNSCFDLSEEDLKEYRKRPKPEVNTEMLELLREGENALGEGTEGAATPGWIRDAVGILEELMQQQYARHFVNAADDNEELMQVWDTCDDLRTLCEKVRGYEMSTPKEIETAVHSLVSTVKSINGDRRSEIYKDSLALQSQFNNRFRTVLTKFESMQASVQAALGVSIERSLRRRARDVPHHAYNTRRSDHNALTAVALASAAGDYDDQPSSSRSTARHQRGYYSSLANGGAEGYGSEEMEVSSSSSRRTIGGRRSVRNEMRMEEDDEEEELPPPRRIRVARTRRVIVDEDVDMDMEEDVEAPLIPSDEERDNAEEEEGEDDAENSEDEEYSISQSKKSKKGARKRIAESTEDDESANASTSTSSSTRRSQRKRKRMKKSSEEDDDEDNWPRGGRKKKESSRPTRSSARNSQQTYDERSDEEDDERMTASISQRGRQRKARRFDD